MNPPRNPVSSEWDVSRIQCLADELGDPKPAMRFLAKYLAMLPQRVERIVHACEEQDEAETTTALLSLKISSAMVGALETEHQCRAIESMIRGNHFDDAAQALPSLQQTADRCLASRSNVIRAAHASLNRHRGYFHS